eukprot:2633108-Amphidinium_carterae.1
MSPKGHHTFTSVQELRRVLVALSAALSSGKSKLWPCELLGCHFAGCTLRQACIQQGGCGHAAAADGVGGSIGLLESLCRAIGVADCGTVVALWRSSFR